MENLSLTLRRAPIRLAIVVLLSLVVAGACYGVSLTPVGQSLVGSHGGPPAGRGAGAPAGKPQVSATAPADPATSTDSGVAAPQAALARPAGGGGRPASLSRGLPELAQNAGVIAVLILFVAGIQYWLRARRRPQSRRAAA